MTVKEALIQILAIVRTVDPECMGRRNEEIWSIVEELEDGDVHYQPILPGEREVQGL